VELLFSVMTKIVRYSSLAVSTKTLGDRATPVRCVVLVLFAIFVASAIQKPGTSNAASFSSYFRGDRWDFNVTHEALEQSPSWPEEVAEPPLAPRHAARIARQQLEGLVTDSERWRLHTVSLMPVGSDGKWIYVVEFDEPPPRPEGGLHSSIRLVVLMNGFTVSPSRRPWPEQ